MRFLAPKFRFALKAFAALTLAVAAAGFTVMYGGLYDVSAIHQHTRPVHWVLDTGMRQAVKVRAKFVKVPPLEDPVLARRGAQLYRESCLQCHGAPGVAPDPFARGLMPAPNNLVQTALEWTPAELYWVTRNGLKMTAMPAWEYRYPDADLWAIVAFLRLMPRLTAAEYAATKPEKAATTWSPGQAAGDPERGPITLHQYGCTSCHRIPGVVGAFSYVGPPLDGIAGRKYLGGRLPNTPDNLVRWIRDPKGISATTLMPSLDVTDAHARDIAAYLATLD